MTAQKKDRLLIIVPAYNEEKTIEQLIDRLRAPEIAEFADFVIINDGSRDHTAEIAGNLGCKVITQVYNLGYGNALQTGYKYADLHGYTYVMQMDADGQHDSCNIRRIYDELRTPDENGVYPDIIIGSRFMEGSAQYEVGAVKKFAIHLFSGIIRMATRQKITDPTSGLQGLSQRTVKYYAGFNHFDDKYPDANMLIQMLLLGFHVREIPAVMHLRTEGVSMHSGLKPILYMIRMAFSMIAVWGRVRLLHIDVGVTKEEM